MFHFSLQNSPLQVFLEMQIQGNSFQKKVSLLFGFGSAVEVSIYFSLYNKMSLASKLIKNHENTIVETSMAGKLTKRNLMRKISGNFFFLENFICIACLCSKPSRGYSVTRYLERSCFASKDLFRKA